MHKRWLWSLRSKTITIMACALSLSACQTMNSFIEEVKSIDIPGLSDSQPPTSEFVINADCPQTHVIGELSVLSDFSDPKAPAEEDLISHIYVAGIDSTCEYNPQSVTVDINVDFKAKLGPKGRSGNKPFHTYPFFVAVTTPGGKILAKEIFSAPMTFDSGTSTVTYSEDLRQIIPVVDRHDGARHKVLVGFQLTQDQLAYNRKVIELRKIQEAESRKLTEEEAKESQSAVITQPAREEKKQAPSNTPLMLTAPSP